MLKPTGRAPPESKRRSGQEAAHLENTNSSGDYIEELPGSCNPGDAIKGGRLVAHHPELRCQRRIPHAEIVHGLGWRATFEGFDQLGRDFDEDAVDQLLEWLASLDCNLLKAFRFDDLPLSPIHEVRR